jgi:hypothetical protein
MISREDAVAIARARATEKGWGLAEPIAVRDRRSWLGRIRSYDIESNPAMRGSRTRFTIDAMTGAVLSEGHIAR